MEFPKNKTAVLLFTRTAIEEALAKDLSDRHHFQTNYLLAEKFISHAEKIAGKSGLPCFVIHSGLQQGNTFGEKLSNAFAAIFHKGFECVIAIGNDCPALKETDILSAAEKLENYPSVIGPARDGGLYLIGLHRNAFQKNIFEQITWESADTKKSFIQYLNFLEAAYFVADEKQDIDTGNTLIHSLKYPDFSFHFKKLIEGFLSALSIFYFPEVKIIEGNTFLRSSSLKAPPPIINFQ